MNLSCPNCGGKLEITGDINRFACGYCGSEQMVMRSGGTVRLQLITDALARVQMGTDRTAAELAVQRLTQDMVVLKEELAKAQKAHNYFSRGYQFFALPRTKREYKRTLERLLDVQARYNRTKGQLENHRKTLNVL